jgi:hypothetical protein
MLSNQKLGKLGLAALAAAVLMLGTVTTAEAGVTRNEIIQDREGEFINPCNGNPTMFTARSHFLVTQTEDAAGGLHFHFHGDFHGTAIDVVTGDEFIDHEAFNTRFNTREGEPFTETVNDNFHLIAPGQSAGVNYHFVSHMTVNANGDATVDFQMLNVTCEE